jgi:hypothetical protein
MLSSQKPKLIPVAFATSGAKQDIPVTSQISIAAGRASYTDGFPPLTRTPLAAGGIPPYGTDFNGVLNDITAAIRWANAGMGYAYNADFSTSVGGYPKGAQLTKATNDGIWLNTVESNASNPDTGGAGWLDLTAGRLIGTRSITSSGTYTPSPGVKKIRITMCGGGGGGGGCQAADNTQTYSGAGGGGRGDNYNDVRIDRCNQLPGSNWVRGGRWQWGSKWRRRWGNNYCFFRCSWGWGRGQVERFKYCRRQWGRTPFRRYSDRWRIWERWAIRSVIPDGERWSLIFWWWRPFRCRCGRRWRRS